MSWKIQLCTAQSGRGACPRFCASVFNGNFIASIGNSNVSNGNPIDSDRNIAASKGIFAASDGNFNISNGDSVVYDGNSFASKGTFASSNGNMEVFIGSLSASIGNFVDSNESRDAFIRIKRAYAFMTKSSSILHQRSRAIRVFSLFRIKHFN
ncbi:MAG: hypothetical protein WCB68_02385 [Pyrinomonadaceae bacterium]